MQRMINAGLMGLVLAGSASGEAAAQSTGFPSTPVPCAKGSAFRNCAAAFDGKTLTYTFVTPVGGNATAVYPSCTASAAAVTCTGGSWTTDRGGSGVNEGRRSINLRGGRPVSSGH